MQNDNDLTILWYTDMKAGNDVLVHSLAFDVRSERQVGFGIPQPEYQIVALVRLNCPPTDAVSRLPRFGQINAVDTLPRAPQDPAHGD